MEHLTSNPRSSRSRKPLSTYLDDQLLGIIGHLSAIIDASNDRVSTGEKKRSLRAVRTLITVAGTQIGIALPQVRHLSF